MKLDVLNVSVEIRGHMRALVCRLKLDRSLSRRKKVRIFCPTSPTKAEIAISPISNSKHGCMNEYSKSARLIYSLMKKHCCIKKTEKLKEQGQENEERRLMVV